MSNMMSFNNAYKNIIKEQEENLSDEIKNDKVMEKGDIEFKFSNNLADEFTQTMNLFSTICAKMIKSRTVSEDLYDKFIDIHSKLKNLVEACRNSN